MISFSCCLNRRFQIAVACCLLLVAAEGGVLAANNAPVHLFGPQLLLSPAQTGGPKIAIFPVQNMSGMPAPSREIDLEIAALVEQTGARLVSRAEVEQFRERHWVRQVGYIDEQTAELLRRETGADAILLSNIEVFKEDDNPHFSLFSRLVTTDRQPRIIWMESASLIGDENPGVLGLGLISDARRLRGIVMEQICSSLRNFITAPPIRRLLPLASEVREQTPYSLTEQISKITASRAFSPQGPVEDRITGERSETLAEFLKTVSSFGGLLGSRYTPQEWFGSKEVSNDLQRSIAIVPFINLSTRKNAAELLELHLAKQLVSNGVFFVLELGVVRDKLIKMHIVMDEGISVPSIDALTIAMNVDFIMDGKVFDYTESAGQTATPLLDFYVQMFERDTRRILWSSYSHNRGDDGVYFYDVNRISTASTLADLMSRDLVQKLFEFTTLKQDYIISNQH